MSAPALKVAMPRAVENGEVERQNAYLKLRCAQLQGDVVDLTSEITRLRQELERLDSGRAQRFRSSRL